MDIRLALSQDVPAYSGIRTRTQISALIAWVIVAATAVADPQYQIYDLGVAQPNHTGSNGFGVSPDGIAFGRSLYSGTSQAFTWTQGGGLVGLPSLVGRNFFNANGANDSGIVVGAGSDSESGSGSTDVPVIWQNGVVSQLPVPPGHPFGRAYDVNASGVAVGSVEYGSAERGVIFSGGSAAIITPTTPNGSYFTIAYGINDSGLVVGRGEHPSAQFVGVGVVYNPLSNTTISVGTFQGVNAAIAYGVNNNGQVVGESYQLYSSGYPFIWSQATGMVAVPVLDGAYTGFALAVNSAGWVVGTNYLASGYTPFLYDGRTTYRLADLLPAGSGWDLTMTSSSSQHMGISDSGIIVGTGQHNGELRAYAMVPVPATPTPTPTATPSPTPAPVTTRFVVIGPVWTYQFIPFRIAVFARDQFNNTAAGYTGTVHFTSTSSGGLPANATLTNGTGIFSVSLSSPGNQTITATDTSNASITGTSNPIFIVEKEHGSPTPPPLPTATPTPTSTPSPTASPTPSSTPTPTPSPPTKAINLSTRMRVQTGDNVGIGGFIISGTISKHVLLRAIGPSLTQLGVPNALADPVLELHGPGAFPTVTNNNWRDTQEQQILATGIAPTNNLESAIDANLPPGAYTAIVRGNGDSSGVALVEVYDLNQAVDARLANISTRALVGTDDNIVIAGFMLGGNSNYDRIIVRGLGPSLSALGVPGALADPTLQLRDANGSLLFVNNDWQENPDQVVEINAAGLAPTNNLESAMAVTLPPGPYTALLAGLNNGTGIGLVEVYDRGAP